MPNRWLTWLSTVASLITSRSASYDLLGIVSNRQARFFTLILPLLFLVIFVGVFGTTRSGLST